MLRRRWTVCAMTALLFGGTAAAQAPGTLLLGGFGQYTKFDNALFLGNHWGVGGRLGAFFAPNWNLEAENSYNRPPQQYTGQTGQIPGTGMLPVVGQFLNEEDGWKVLLYERSLGEAK